MTALWGEGQKEGKQSKARESCSPPGECDGQNNEGLRRKLAAVN